MARNQSFSLMPNPARRRSWRRIFVLPGALFFFPFQTFQEWRRCRALRRAQPALFGPLLANSSSCLQRAWRRLEREWTFWVLLGQMIFIRRRLRALSPQWALLQEEPFFPKRSWAADEFIGSSDPALLEHFLFLMENADLANPSAKFGLIRALASSKNGDTRDAPDWEALMGAVRALKLPKDPIFHLIEEALALAESRVLFASLPDPLRARCAPLSL